MDSELFLSLPRVHDSVASLLDSLQRTDSLFTDPLFPPTPSSLGAGIPFLEKDNKRNLNSVTWLRSQSLCANPRLVISGGSPSDAKQQFLGKHTMLL
jgi:hypothetical protein